jgi:hypothetical protein
MSRSAVLMSVWVVLGACAFPAFAAPQSPRDTIAVHRVVAADTGANSARAPGDTAAPLADRMPDSASLSATTTTDRKTGSAPPSTTATRTAPVLEEKGEMTEDTTAGFWLDSYWGVGIGWTLGKVPLFDEWANATKFRPFLFLMRALPIDTEKEAPNTYSTTFPLSLSFTPFTLPSGNLAAIADFQFMQKKSTGLWNSSRDSLYWNHFDNLRFWSLSVGVQYIHQIAEEFFKIENVKRATLTIGLSALPLVMIIHQQRDSTNMLRAILTSNRRYRGAGLTWRAGIATFQKLESGNAVETGICYEGNWYGSFSMDHHPVNWRSINPSYRLADEPLSFLSNRFKLYAQFILTKKAKSEQTTAAPSPPSGSPPLPPATGDTLALSPPADTAGFTTDSLHVNPLPVIRAAQPADTVSRPDTPRALPIDSTGKKTNGSR